MINGWVVKIMLAVLIFAPAIGVPVYACTRTCMDVPAQRYVSPAGYIGTVRSPWDTGSSSKTPEKTSYKTIHRMHHSRRLDFPDEMMTSNKITPLALNNISGVILKAFQISSHSLSDIFIPPKAFV